MKTSKWYKSTAFRTITGAIFLLSGISALFQSGSIVENLATGIVSLVIAFFIFPKILQNYLLNFMRQKANSEATAEQLTPHNQKDDDDWAKY